MSTNVIRNLGTGGGVPSLPKLELVGQYFAQDTVLTDRFNCTADGEYLIVVAHCYYYSLTPELTWSVSGQGTVQALDSTKQNLILLKGSLKAGDIVTFNYNSSSTWNCHGYAAYKVSYQEAFVMQHYVIGNSGAISSYPYLASENETILLIAESFANPNITKPTIISSSEQSISININIKSSEERTLRLIIALVTTTKNETLQINCPANDQGNSGYAMIKFH